MMKEKLEAHPAAEIFPAMDDEAYAALKADILAHGLIEPIEIFEGKIIDGRHRYRACVELGLPFVQIGKDIEDPIAYVISKNQHRRHLTKSQFAMVAAKSRELYDAAAKERQARKPVDSVVEAFPQQNLGKARDQAGKAVGVSGKLVDAGTTVLTGGDPALVKAVDDGKVSVTKAAKQIKAKAKPEPKPPKNGQPTFNPEKFKVVYEYLGHALPKLGALNRTNPTKFYQQAETAVKAAMQAVDDWRKALRP